MRNVNMSEIVTRMDFVIKVASLQKESVTLLVKGKKNGKIVTEDKITLGRKDSLNLARMFKVELSDN